MVPKGVQQSDKRPQAKTTVATLYPFHTHFPRISTPPLPLFSCDTIGVEKDEYESHFYIAIEILNMAFSTWDDEGPDLRCVRSHIQSFACSYWRKRYLEEFDQYFGPSPLMSFGSKPRVKRVSLDPATFEEE